VYNGYMKIFSILLFIAVAILTFDALRMYSLYQNTRKLEKIMPFQREFPDASDRILVLGDSTAAGTGTSDNKYSTAGRLASLFPGAEIINISENGLQIGELTKKLEDVDGRYDLILIQIGANDIIRLTGMNAIDLELQKLLTMANELSDKVIILHSGDIGKSKFFPVYVRPILSSRSRQVRDIYIKNAETFGVSYVDLFDVEMTDETYSDDKLHPNDAGYEIWFKEIMKKI
jgi:lysophospholipase L1-like esterase